MKSQFEVRVVWGDCDGQGIAFYPNYFYWMDSAFQSLLREAGYCLGEMRTKFNIVGLPIVEANARFLNSVTHEEILTIDAEVRHWGNTSLRVEYEGFCGDRPIFEAFETRVWLGHSEDGRPATVSVPSSFKQAFAT